MVERERPPARVMVVEEDAVVATEIAQRIEALGHEVTAVLHSGEQALSAATERRPDLALVAFSLGGPVDALELAERLRAQLQLPIIYLVGASELERARSGLPGTAIFVLKPGGVDALHSSIELSLELQRVRQNLEATAGRHREALADSAAVEALAQLGSWTQDLVTGELAISSECRRLHDLPPGAGCPSLATLWSRVRRSDREGLETLVRHAREQATSDATDYRIALPGGEERVVHHRLAVQTTPDGRPRRLVATVQDVTEQQRAQEALRQSEARASRLLEERDFILQYSRDVLYYIDHNGMVYYISPAVEQLTGIPPEEWIGDFRKHMVDSEHSRRVVVETLDILRTGREYPPNIVQFRKRDGEILSAEVSERAIIKEGQVHGIVGVARDVTERLQVESRLRQAAAVFENTLEAIIITDPQRRIAAVNRSFVDITGYGEPEVLGMNPDFLAAGDEPAHFREEVWNAVTSTGHWYGEMWNRRKSGEAFPAWAALSTIWNAAQQPANFVIVMSDLSHLKESEEKLDQLAHYDALTRLPNRLLFNSRLAHAIRRAEREQNSVAVMFIDLDHFKIVNDTLGHPAGDRLLQQVGNRLGGCLRRQDTIARLGGDEFVVILEDVGDSRFLADVASKTLECLSQPYAVDGEETVVTASIGISLFPQDGRDVTRLVQNADAAMYRAKELGRASFQFYTAELTAHAVERMSMENALRAALRRSEFTLHYQPQVSLETGEVVGVEALIRWRHPQRGLLLPTAFIELGEQTGLILAIGDWVLRTACTQVKGWVDAGAKPVTLAVNVSARQFASAPSLVAKVAAVLEETGLSPGALQLEITETAIMGNAEEAVEAVKALKSLGVSVAIDDFGTGYSSMMYLKRFAVDKLKTDKSFVQHLPQDASDSAITQAIIALGHSLHVKVIAEGVESPEQQAFLREQGCDEMQGYLFSPPLPEPECLRLLMRGR